MTTHRTLSSTVSKRFIAIFVLVLIIGAVGFLLREPIIGLFDQSESADVTTAESVETLYRAIDEKEGSEVGDYVTQHIDDPAVSDRVKAEAYKVRIAQAYEEAQGSPDLSVILEWALESHRLYPSAATARAVAIIYEELGNVEKAIEYHRLAIEQETPEEQSSEGGSSSGFHEARIQYLQDNPGEFSN